MIALAAVIFFQAIGLEAKAQWATTEVQKTSNTLTYVGIALGGVVIIAGIITLIVVANKKKKVKLQQVSFRIPDKKEKITFSGMRPYSNFSLDIEHPIYVPTCSGEIAKGFIRSLKGNSANTDLCLNLPDLGFKAKFKTTLDQSNPLITFKKVNGSDLFATTKSPWDHRTVK